MPLQFIWDFVCVCVCGGPHMVETLGPGNRINTSSQLSLSDSSSLPVFRIFNHKLFPKYFDLLFDVSATVQLLSLILFCLL